MAETAVDEDVTTEAPAASTLPAFVPHPGPQTIAFTRMEYELCYGGAVGGGKTCFLIVDALGLQFRNSPLGKAAVQVPEYRAVMFRRKSTEFMKLIEEGRKYYERDWGARFIWGRRGDPGPSFTFPSGARIFICHLEKEGNKHDHDSNEYQYLGFDQVEQFTLTQYLHLLTRTRTTIPGLFVRVRVTANWIGSGLKWVRTRFYRNIEPYQQTWWKPDVDALKNPQGLTAKPGERDALSRTFIPAKLTDNPTLMTNDPFYAARIKARGKKYERALLDGDPDAFSGDFFGEFNQDMVIDPFMIPPEWKLVGSFDPGWTSPCSFSLRAVDFKGCIYRISTYYVASANMTTNVNGIYEHITKCRWTRGRMPELIVSGHDAWARHDRLAIIGEELTYADMFQAKGIVLQRAVLDRVNGWGVVNNVMAEKRWFCFDLLNEPFIEELQAAEHDELDPNDLKGRGNDPEVMDHALDEERYGDMAVYKPRVKKETRSEPRDYRGKEKPKKGWLPGMR